MVLSHPDSSPERGDFVDFNQIFYLAVKTVPLIKGGGFGVFPNPGVVDWNILVKQVPKMAILRRSSLENCSFRDYHLHPRKEI